MRRMAGLMVAAAAAAVGAVVLGEYDLRGLTAIIGFPVYGLAVTEIATAIGGRLRAWLAVVAAVVASGLAWAMWISFNHFIRESPPAVSWVMLVAAVVLAVGWGMAGHSQPSEKHDSNTAADVAPGASSM